LNAIPVKYLHINSSFSPAKRLARENPQEDRKTLSYRICLWKIRSNLWKIFQTCVEMLGNLWGKLTRKIRIANRDMRIEKG
jgi:hypothetical protein